MIRKVLCITALLVVSNESISAAAETEGIFGWLTGCFRGSQVTELALASERQPSDQYTSTASSILSLPRGPEEVVGEEKPQNEAPVILPAADLDLSVASASPDRKQSTRSIRDLSTASSVDIHTKRPNQIAAQSHITEAINEKDGSPKAGTPVHETGAAPEKILVPSMGPSGEIWSVLADRQDFERHRLRILSLAAPKSFLKERHPDWSEDQIQVGMGNVAAIRRLHPDWRDEQVQEAMDNSLTALSPRVLAALNGKDHKPQVITPEGLSDDKDLDEEELPGKVPGKVLDTNTSKAIKPAIAWITSEPAKAMYGAGISTEAAARGKEDALS